MSVAAAIREKYFLLSSYQTSSNFIYDVHLCRSSPEYRHRLLQSVRAHRHTHTLHIQLPSNASYKLNKQYVRVFRVFTTTPLFPELRSFSFSVSHASGLSDPLLHHTDVICIIFSFVMKFLLFVAESVSAFATIRRLLLQNFSDHFL